MSVIKNNKTYGIRVKIEEVQPNPFADYLTCIYQVQQPSDSFSILENTNNISGWRYKGETEWRTPETTIQVTTSGLIEIEFNLTDNTLIDTNQFRDCNVRKAILTPTITTINANAFFRCGLYEFPNLDNVTYIGDDCFYAYYARYVDYVINDSTDRTNWSQKTFNTYIKTGTTKIYVNGDLYSINSRYGELDLRNGIDGLPIYRWRLGNMWESNLSVLRLPDTLTSIKAFGFNNSTITDLYFYGTVPPTEEPRIDADYFTPFTGCNVTNIYVPAASVDAYKANTAFQDVVDKIQAMA